MLRARRRMGGSGDLPRKLVGLGLAVAGIAIIIDKVPVFIWWSILGMTLIIVGWRIYVG